MLDNICIKISMALATSVLLGYLRTDYHIKQYDFPVIQHPTGSVKIYGTIEEEVVNVRKDKSITKEVIMSVDRIENMNEIPQKLQIRLKNPHQEIYLTKAIIRASIFPIDSKSLYSDFDLRRHYYFKKIGGVAYAGMVIFNDSEGQQLTMGQKITNIRKKIAERVVSVRKNSQSTGIIAILLTGQRGFADKQTIENMNFAGLAHLLSISGLHMMTLIGFIFFIVKWLLLRFETVALKYNVFKISSIISLLVNFIYLLLSGANVSAIRAYIMSVILLTSIIVGRFSDSMRSIMFVMFVLTFLTPSAVFSVGFQMSFSAVMALIALIEYYNDYRANNDETIFTHYSRTKLGKFLIFGFLTSIAAECATTPFSIYSFNNYSFYNVIINSFVTPIVSFWVLPLSLASLFLLPFNLESMAILPASYAMDIVIYISNFIVKIPNSVKFVQSPSNFAMFMMILGLSWFCLWREKWRKFGIILYALGLFAVLLQEKPDVIIDNKDKMILFFDGGGDIYALNAKKYKILALSRKFGRNEYFDLDEKTLNNCHKGKCTKVDMKNGKIDFHKGEKSIHMMDDGKTYVIGKNDSMKVIVIQ
jgi:competence protein ComEC